MSAKPFTVDSLAQIIREEDGDHSLGAGALAERIMARLPVGAFVRGALPPPPNAAALSREFVELRDRHLRLHRGNQPHCEVCLLLTVINSAIVFNWDPSK